MLRKILLVLTIALSSLGPLIVPLGASLALSACDGGGSGGGGDGSSGGW